MKKTMICVIAPTNTGKTTTIKKLHELLGGKEGKRNNGHDFIDVLMYGGVKIGCESAGDPPGEEQKEAIEHLMDKEKCDIIISASRTRGVTVNNAWDLLSQYGYDIIWFTPAYVYDPLNGSVDNIYDVFAQKNAETLMELIRQLISGKIRA